MKFNPEDFWGIKQDKTIKVGDRVKVVDDCYNVCLGKTGVVTEVITKIEKRRDDTFLYYVKFDDKTELLFYEHELELVD